MNKILIFITILIFLVFYIRLGAKTNAIVLTNVSIICAFEKSGSSMEYYPLFKATGDYYAPYYGIFDQFSKNNKFSSYEDIKNFANNTFSNIWNKKVYYEINSKAKQKCDFKGFNEYVGFTELKL